MTTTTTSPEAAMAAPQMPRLRTWQSALDALLSARLNAPFVWGQHDCCLFAADAVLAITGQDLAASLRGTYATEEEAAALVQSLGGVAALVTARLGDPMPSALARPGDVGLVEIDGRQSLAVCIGRHWQAPGPDGLRVLPRSMVLQAWGVGL